MVFPGLKTPIRYLAVSISSVFYLAAVLVYIHAKIKFGYSTYESFTFYLSLTMLVTGSVRLANAQFKLEILIVLFIKLLFSLIISYTLISDLYLESPIFVAFIFEFAFYVTFSKHHFLAFLMIFITVGLRNLKFVFFAGVIEHPLFSYAFLTTLLLQGAFSAKYLSYFSHRRKQDKTRISELEKRIGRLSHANVAFQEYAKEVFDISARNERKRISRDIHDTVGHILTNIKAMMEIVINISPVRETKLMELHYQVRDQAHEGLRETRKALHELRKEEKTPLSGLKNIFKLVETFRNATGIVVNFNYGNARWFYTRRLDWAIYGIIQEGLTNSFRHGNATQIDINFWEHEDSLSLVIRDNGKGVTTIKRGIGLTGMEERLARYGGQVKAENIFPGFKLEAIIPLDNLEEYVKEN